MHPKDGAIRGGEVLGLTFEGFLNGVSIGSNNQAMLQARARCEGAPDCVAWTNTWPGWHVARSGDTIRLSR